MAYIETKDRQINILTTVFVTVKYDFLEEEISIPVVNPSSEDDIQSAISNREITERNKLIIE